MDSMVLLASLDWWEDWSSVLMSNWPEDHQLWLLLCPVLKVALWDPQLPPPHLSKVNTTFSVHLGSVWRREIRAGEESCWEWESLHRGSDFASCLKNLENLAKYWRHPFPSLWRQRSKSQRSAAAEALTSGRVNLREEGSWRREFSLLLNSYNF